MATVHFGKIDAPGGFNRVVAIKRLHPHLAADKAVAALFLDEARLAARIRHANVVPTLDVVAEKDEVFLVMEYVAGVSLADLRRAAQRALPVAVAAKIMMDVLEGLHAAHEAVDEQGVPLRIVHRDMSPQNVMVGSDGTARVLDFGIAKAVGRSHTTQDGGLKGKPSYMAPEQIEGGRVDRRTDVYAAAVTFWEVLAGTELFPAETPVAAMMRSLREAAPAPSTHNPSVSRGLDEVVLRGLAKRPDERFPTARAFADAIEQTQRPSTARGVGRYLEDTAAEVLSARAQQLAYLVDDDGQRSAVAPAEKPPAPAAPTAPSTANEGDLTHFEAVATGKSRSDSAKWRALAVGAAASVIVATAALTTRHLFERERAESPPIPTARAASPMVEAAVPARSAPPASPSAPPNTEPAPSALAPLPSSSSLAASNGPTPSAAGPRQGKKAPQRNAAACSPPWTLDAEGLRVLKPECQ